MLRPATAQALAAVAASKRRAGCRPLVAHLALTKIVCPHKFPIGLEPDLESGKGQPEPRHRFAISAGVFALQIGTVKSPVAAVQVLRDFSASLLDPGSLAKPAICFQHQQPADPGTFLVIFAKPAAHQTLLPHLNARLAA